MVAALASYADKVSAVRGSPKRYTDFMEAFQEAYVRSVAAAAGCVIGRPEIDEGIDLSLTHRAENHNGDGVARLEVQMKATAVSMPQDCAFVSSSISRDRHNYFCSENPTVPKIVVIMVMPKNPANWLDATSEALLLRNCAYWVNLEGNSEVATNKVTIKAPTSQPFTDVALCGIMDRIGKGDKP